MKKELKITNEDLAIMMEKGFDNFERKTDKKIDDLARMIQNNVVDKMATKEDLHALEGRFGVLENKFDILDDKVDLIDKNVKEINMKIYDIEESVHGEHRQRIEKLEGAVFEK